MLRIVYRRRHRNLPKSEGRGSGPQGRINKMRQLVTSLVRHERIEGFTLQLDESRGYAERLIQEAIDHGDTDTQTMQLADYWLLEKDLIHKLFKVLVPRYQNYHTSFTQMWNLPIQYPGRPIPHTVLELKENPWPPVVPHMREVKGSLVNVLLDASKKDYRFKRNSSDGHMSNKSLRDSTACKDDNETVNSNVD